jgi:hypothetical protein
MYALQGKPDQHTTFIPCLVCVWSQTIRISRSQYIAIFCVVVNIVEQGHCSWEIGLLTQFTACWLTDQQVHTGFSPKTVIEAVGAKPTFCWRSATRLTGSISPACDQYVQYLLTGANPSVLNRHKWRLQLWRCWLSTSHSSTFPTNGHSLST